MTGSFTSFKKACLFLFQRFYFHSALVALQTSPEGLDCCQNAECYFHISIPHRKGSWETPLSPVCQLKWPGSETSHSPLHTFSCNLQRVYLFSINHTQIHGKRSVNLIKIVGCLTRINMECTRVNTLLTNHIFSNVTHNTVPCSKHLTSA